VTPTLQSELIESQAAVICTERETDTECDCVCCEDVGKDNRRTLWRVLVNCGPNKYYITNTCILQDVYTCINLNYSLLSLVLTNDKFTVVLFRWLFVSHMTSGNILCLCFCFVLRFKTFCILYHIFITFFILYY
jgi:hypothetical protein